jgi:competence protein ComEA
MKIKSEIYLRKDGFVMKAWLMEHKLYLAAFTVIALGGMYYFFIDSSVPPPITSISEVENNLPAEEKGPAATGQQTELNEPEKIIVDVKGQVKKPGVYSSSQGERVIDVINRAGGITENADESQVNFAEHVQDAMVIYIPAKGEEGLEIAGTSITPSGSGSSGKPGMINLNKADVNELQTLPGIGPAKAASIIEYRETNGPFKAVEDLKNISGIGEKTFEKLKELISVH